MRLVVDEVGGAQHGVAEQGAVLAGAEGVSGLQAEQARVREGQVGRQAAGSDVDDVEHEVAGGHGEGGVGVVAEEEAHVGGGAVGEGGAVDEGQAGVEVVGEGAEGGHEAAQVRSGRKVSVVPESSRAGTGAAGDGYEALAAGAEALAAATRVSATV